MDSTIDASSATTDGETIDAIVDERMTALLREVDERMTALLREAAEIKAWQRRMGAELSRLEADAEIKAWQRRMALSSVASRPTPRPRCS